MVSLGLDKKGDIGDVKVGMDDLGRWFDVNGKQKRLLWLWWVGWLLNAIERQI